MNSSPPPPPDPNEPKLNQLKERGFKSTFEQSPTKNHVERRNKVQQEHRAQLLNQRRGAGALAHHGGVGLQGLGVGVGLANGTNGGGWMHPGASPPSQSLRSAGLASMNGGFMANAANRQSASSVPSASSTSGANGMPPASSSSTSSMADADGDNAMGEESSSSGGGAGGGFSLADADNMAMGGDEQTSSSSSGGGFHSQSQSQGGQGEGGAEAAADGLDALLESFSKLSVERPKSEKCIICLKDIEMDKNYVPHVYECLEKQDNDLRLAKIRAYQQENNIQQHCRWAMKCHHRDEAHFMDFIHPDGHPGPRSFSLSKHEMDPQFLEPVRMVNCPVCQYRLADFQMNEHLDTCTKEQKLLAAQKQSPTASSSSPSTSSSSSSSMSDVSNVHSNAMPRPPNQRPPSQQSPPMSSSASQFSYPKDPLDEDDKSDDEDDDSGALNLPQVVAFSEHAMSVKNHQGEREYQEVLRKMEQMGLNQKSLQATMTKHQKDSSNKAQQNNNGFPPPQQQQPPPGGAGGASGSFTL